MATAKKAPAKKAEPETMAAPAKDAAPAKKAAPVKAAAPAKKAAAKAAAEKVEAPASTEAPAKAAAPAKKAATAKQAAPAPVVEEVQPASLSAPVVEEAKPESTSAFMKKLIPSSALAAVVGAAALPRTEVVKKLWDYIKANNLQDTVNRRAVNADAKLKEVFGKAQVTMFEIAGLIGKHLK